MIIELGRGGSQYEKAFETPDYSVWRGETMP